MPYAWPYAPGGAWSVVRRVGPLLLLAMAMVMAGCGGSAPAPAPEGRPPFSYDDDEVDPANLPPPGAPARPGAPG